MMKKVDAKKVEQEWLQKILQDMLRLEDNKYCADCSAKTPRWAAWNLGVFICIRCAGIHRNLGVHISKVRSVNLDSWSPEQVQSMRVMGNEKSRRIYEHSLPDNFKRGMADHQMEKFIRTKYEQKRYIIKDFVYPRVDASDLPKPNDPKTMKRTTVSDAIQSSQKSNGQQPSVSVNDLLDFSSSSGGQDTGTSSGNGSTNMFDDFSSVPSKSQETTDLEDDFGSFVSAGAPSSNDVFGISAPPAAATTAVPALDLFANAPAIITNHSLPAPDLFGGAAVSATPSTATSQPSPSGATEDLMGLATSSATGGLDDRKSTADILSLFGSNSGQAPQLVAPGGFAAFGMQAATQSAAQMQSATAALAGLNMGAGTAMGGGTSTQHNNFMGGPTSHGVDGAHGGGMNPAAFPNPFGPPGAAPGGMMGGLTNFGAPHNGSLPQHQAQHAPTAPVYSPPASKTNAAFADLSLGNVMNSMHAMSTKPKTPSPQPTMMTSQPMHTQTAAVTSPNLDDLLGF